MSSSNSPTRSTHSYARDKPSSTPSSTACPDTARGLLRDASRRVFFAAGLLLPVPLAGATAAAGCGLARFRLAWESARDIRLRVRCAGESAASASSVPLVGLLAFACVLDFSLAVSALGVALPFVPPLALLTPLPFVLPLAFPFPFPLPLPLPLPFDLSLAMLVPVPCVLPVTVGDALRLVFAGPLDLPLPLDFDLDTEGCTPAPLPLPPPSPLCEPAVIPFSCRCSLGLPRGWPPGASPAAAATTPLGGGANDEGINDERCAGAPLPPPCSSSSSPLVAYPSTATAA